MTNVSIHTYAQWLIRIGDHKSNYPYYNFFCTRTGIDELFVLEIAVAGIREEQIKIFMSKQNFLTIVTDIDTQVEHDYIHKGIAKRNFKEIFKVHYSLKMLGEAHLEDGILRIIFTKMPQIGDDVESVKILTRAPLELDA